jgi:hypothetical protein
MAQARVGRRHCAQRVGQYLIEIVVAASYGFRLGAEGLSVPVRDKKPIAESRHSRPVPKLRRRDDLFSEKTPYHIHS